MMKSRLLTVLVSGTLLVGAANLGAYAANGKPLLLGKTNTATKPTTVKNTGNGPALKIKSKKTKPPFTVNSRQKVKKLNADLLDGVSASALGTTTYVYRLSGNTTEEFLNWSLPGLPRGKYLVGMNIPAASNGSIVICAVATDDFSAIDVSAFSSPTGPGVFLINSAGYVDTTDTAARASCTRQGGSTMQVPAFSSYRATLTFTVVDTADAGPVVGTGGTSARPGVGGARGAAPFPG